ncbi:MAG: hypothetical protein V4699_01550 [Patescibacteria group bacterium]
MENKKTFTEVIVLALIVGNVFFAFNYFSYAKELKAIKSVATKVELNEKITNFTALFIKKVLQADKEVDFETRLSLENAVRDLKDEEVMAEWQKFTSSKTEAEAQNSVKRLLGILVAKIQK